MSTLLGEVCAPGTEEIERARSCISTTKAAYTARACFARTSRSSAAGSTAYESYELNSTDYTGAILKIAQLTRDRPSAGQCRRLAAGDRAAAPAGGQGADNVLHRRLQLADGQAARLAGGRADRRVARARNGRPSGRRGVRRAVEEGEGRGEPNNVRVTQYVRRRRLHHQGAGRASRPDQDAINRGELAQGAARGQDLQAALDRRRHHQRRTTPC